MIAIDLGSNSFRCIEYDCDTSRFGRSFERIVRTADKMHETGRISEDSVLRIIQALEEADAELDLRSNTVRAVTTHAMRIASNAKQVLQRIEEKSGVEFSIISADDEAYYTLISVEARLKTLQIDSSHFVLIDVGGGSSEIIFFKEGKMESRSFPVGIVTTAQICDQNEDIDEYLQQQFKALVTYIDDYYKREGRPGTFVATAGTPTTMAAYMLGMNYSNYDVDKVNGYSLTYEATQTVYDALLNMGETERAEMVGVGRESLIIAGIVIVQKLYHVLGFDAAVVIDDGVREGVAIAYCAENETHP